MAETYDTEWQLATLRESVANWNLWREEHPEISINLGKVYLSRVDLSQANLSRAHLRGAHLSDANLSRANLVGADLTGATLHKVRLHDANLSEAHLGGAHLTKASLSRANLSRAHLIKADLQDTYMREAHLSGADLRLADLMEADLSEAQLVKVKLVAANLMRAKLIRANLVGADLSGADLSGADLTDADLSGANLTMSSCVGTSFRGATLTGCRVYGISIWDVQLDHAIQHDLCITPKDQAAVTVENLKVAQFIYLLLNNVEIRDVIDTVAKKVVLILGRFSPKRKVVLDALRNELRNRNYSPVVFDFAKPASRDLTETISTLAHLSRFVVADLTEAKSIPQELSVIVPNLPSVTVQPLVQEGDSGYAMFEHWRRYPWVLNTYHYTNLDSLLANLKECVIDPPEAKAKELFDSQQSTVQAAAIASAPITSESDHTP